MACYEHLPIYKTAMDLTVCIEEVMLGAEALMFQQFHNGAISTHLEIVASSMDIFAHFPLVFRS